MYMQNLCVNLHVIFPNLYGNIRYCSKDFILYEQTPKQKCLYCNYISHQRSKTSPHTKIVHIMYFPTNKVL